MVRAFDNIDRLTKNIQDRRIGTVKTRRNFVWAFIGANRTGKTVEAIAQARAYKEANPKNKIIGYDPQDFFKKARVLDTEIRVTDKNWGHILCKKDERGEFVYKDSLLILDDYRQLHPNNSMDDGFLALLGSRTKMNLDIIYITHMPTLVLVRLAGFTNRYSIFFTFAQLGGFAKDIPNYIACQQASILINKYVKEYGLLDKGRELYPYFPHIVIDAADDLNLELAYIDKEKLMKVA